MKKLLSASDSAQPFPATADVLFNHDLLCIITSYVGASDLLCWAMVCKAFHVAQDFFAQD